MADFGSTRIAGDATVTRNIKVSGQIKSLLPSGTAPLVLISNTLVTNLNSDLLDGQHGSYYLDWANLTGKPNYIINITPGVGLTLSGTAGVGWTPTLSMGTPSTLNTSTTNSVTGTTHTHLITTASSNTVSTIVARDGSGNFSAGTITAALSGNASTATKWETTRTITLTGGVTSSATNIDGSGNVSIDTTLSSHPHGNITNDGKIGAIADLMVKTTTSGALTTLAAGSPGQYLQYNGTWATPPDTNYFPIEFTWTGGTTSGPTGSLSRSGLSALTFPAIPSATASASGIVTNSTQEFGGKKTFRGGSGYDGIAIAPQLSGTNNYAITLSNSGLSGNFTIYLPNGEGTLARLEDLHSKYHAMTSTDHTAGNWKLFYSNATGQVAELGLGAPSQVLKSNGASSIPSWQTLDMSYLPDSAFKKSVRVATTSNITLSAPQTIDGIAVVAEDRVLVKNQTTASQNGIYVVKAGAWIRAVSADASTEIAGGVVNVDSGTQGGFLYSNNFKTTDTLGTTSMPWYKIYSEFDAATAGTANKLALRDGSGNITANGIIGTTTLTLDSTTTNAVNLGTGASAKTVTIGNGTGATSVVINAGTGALSIGANAIARTNTFANTTGAGITYLYGGTGGISLLTGTTGSISIDSGTTGAINIGTNANAKTVTIGNGTGASGVVVNSGTAGVIFNQVATGVFKIQTTAIPTTDAVQITNSGYAVTTAGVNALAITYVGGSAAIESSAMRLDLTPGTTSGGIWSGLRILPTASAATGVTQNGIKFDNITAGAGTDNMLSAGTGWDNILSYGGTSIINGTGLVNATKLTGIVPTANGGTGTTSTTGSGSVVFATSPTLVTPILGAATGTSLTVRSSAAYDGISFSGRAGGTGTYTVSVVPATLSANRTLTLPNNTGTVALEANTHYIGTTAVALNRASATLALTGISGISHTADMTVSSSAKVILSGTQVDINSNSVNVQSGGSYKINNIDILDLAKPIRSTSVSVLTSAWVLDTTYPDYGYRASVTISGVTDAMIPHVYFSYADSVSGIYSTFSDTYNGGVYIYASEIPSATITIPLIECAR